jgi:hypothetical protein
MPARASAVPAATSRVLFFDQTIAFRLGDASQADCIKGVGPWRVIITARRGVDSACAHFGHA